MAKAQIIEGDCRNVLASLDAGSVQTCVTSPPYYGLRDYGHEGQIGLEETPGHYIERLVEVFWMVRRVLADDGTVWLNLGDSYAGSWGAQSRGGPPSESSTLRGNGHVGGGPKLRGLSDVQIAAHPKGQTNTGSIPRDADYKAKDLLMIPAQVALALRADGWYLRSDIIWAKPNPMPESVTDRPSGAHEHIFLLAKSARYFYDAAAIREDFADERMGNPGAYTRTSQAAKGANNDRADTGFLNNGEGWNAAAGRNKRNVWTVATTPYSGAHFATFPPKLIEPCILAGSRPGDTVLDPFNGAGTTGMVALRHDRNYIGIELNPDYAQMARDRIYDDGPLLNVEVAA